jgi:glucokinase
MILAGDIGGTSTRLALFEREGSTLRVRAEQKYPSQQYSALEEIVTGFISGRNLAIEHACFGIAGPVLRGRVEAPNLAWIVDGESLAQRIGQSKVTLINDLEANAYGIAMLQPQDFVVLNSGASDVQGNAAVISAGTGLGEAGMYWDGQWHHPFACEGGHGDFAPRDELECELMLYLRRQFGRVSYERVLSGPGLFNIYEFLRDTGRGEDPPWMAAELAESDPSVVVSQHGLSGSSPLSVQALNLFVSFYGAEAGNLALKLMALGGVYLGGGIAPKIVEKLKGSIFLDAFTAKGRLSPVVKEIPVRVVMNDRAALLGAAHCGARFTATQSTAPF